MSSSVKVSPHNSAIIDINSFRLKSAQLSAMKKVGKPNYFTMAKTSYSYFFQYAGVPLIVPMN